MDELRSFLDTILAGAPTPQPAEATLVPGRPRPDVAARVSEVERLGFEVQGCWRIEEMPGVVLMGLAHADLRQAAAYWHPGARAVVTDFVAQTQDGEELTVSDAPAGHHIETRPGCTKVFLPGSSATALADDLRERLAGRALVDLGPFDAAFRDAYRKDMDFLAQRGGPSVAEVQAIAADMGLDEDACGILQTAEEVTDHLHHRRADSLRARFEERAERRRWRRVGPRSLVLWEGMDRGFLLRGACRLLGRLGADLVRIRALEDEAVVVGSEPSPGAVFAELAASCGFEVEEADRLEGDRLWWVCLPKKEG